MAISWQRLTSEAVKSSSKSYIFSSKALFHFVIISSQEVESHLSFHCCDPCDDFLFSCQCHDDSDQMEIENTHSCQNHHEVVYYSLRFDICHIIHQNYDFGFEYSFLSLHFLRFFLSRIHSHIEKYSFENSLIFLSEKQKEILEWVRILMKKDYCV